MHIGQFLSRSAQLFSAVCAVDDGKSRATYGELNSSVRKLTDALSKAGIKPGSRVAVVAKNNLAYVELYFACAELGAVLVALNWRLKPAELGPILSDAEPCMLIAAPEFLADLDRCGLDREWLKVSLGQAQDPWRSWTDLRELGDSSAAQPVSVAAKDDDLAVMMYSSGTTGKPKGVPLSHRNVVSMTQAWLLDVRLNGGVDRFLQVTPLFHVGGMLMVMSNIAAGSTLILLPEFDPAAALAAFERERISVTLMVPAMIQWLFLEPALANCSFEDLRLVLYGAAPFPEQALKRAMETFHCDFLQGYGLTETAGVITTLLPSDHTNGTAQNRLTSAGRAVACSEVRILNAAGEPAAAGEVGEIVARGDNITPGYWRNEAATQAAFVDGWLRTGDMGRMDADGYITIVDRLKHMILVGGENVYPSEVENVLLKHADVRDAAVIGIPHPVWGEEVLAVVVLAETATVSDRQLITYVREQLARYKCPTKIDRLDELPRNSAGKVEKHRLREPYWVGRERKI